MPASRRIGRLLERLRGEGIGAVLARGASLFLAVQLVGVAVAFGVQVLLARAMGAAEYGTYVYVYNWLLVLLLVCRGGLGTASLRYVSAYVATADWGRLRGFLRLTRVSVLLTSALMAVLTAGAVAALGDRLPAAMRATFYVACLGFPVYAFLQVQGFVLRGLKRVLLSQLPAAVFQPAFLGLGALAVLTLAPGSLDAPAGMALNVGSAVLGLAFSSAALRAARPVESRRAAAVMETGDWMRVAMPLLAFNALNMVIQRTDILLVGSLLGATEAGVYAAASRVAGVLAFGLTAVNAWAAPLISDLHARGDRANLQRLVRLAAQGIFVFTLPAAIGVSVFGRELLGLFGPEFTEASWALVFLAASQLVNALAGPVGFLMTMTGRQNTAARILAVHAVMNLALNAALIPPFGIEGAAVATGVTRASWNLVMAIAVWRTMRLRATIL